MKLTRDVTLTPKELAEAWIELDDEQQAQFFIEAAALAEQWRERGGLPTMQWYVIGKHLKTCSCSTYEARAMVTEIAEAIQ